MKSFNTTAEIKLFRLIKLGLATNPLVEMLYYTLRHARPTFDKKNTEELLNTLIQIQDCLPPGICNLQCRESDIAYSYMLGDADAEDVYKELVDINLKVFPEDVLARNKTNIKKLEGLVPILEQHLSSLKEQGMIHFSNAFCPMVFDLLNNFNVILNKEIFSYPKDRDQLISQFQKRVQDLNVMNNKDKEDTFFNKKSTKKQEYLNLQTIQTRVADSQNNPMLFMELLKSYISSVEIAHEVKNILISKKDFQLVEDSLDFLKQHMTQDEFKTTLKEITELVNVVAREKNPHANFSYNVEEKYNVSSAIFQANASQ